MSRNEKISQVLKQYFDIEESKLNTIAIEIEDKSVNELIEKSKIDVLKEMELHSQAHQLIEDEVSKFREELYTYSKRIANREFEESIVTKSHVLKAREFLWKKKSKYDWSDGFLALGGLLCGSGLPHLIEDPSKPNIILIGFAIAGGFLLGMGIVSKSKG